MSQPGRNELMLGRIGAFLASENARRIDILDEGDFLAVSWAAAGRSERRCFREADLAALLPGPAHEAGRAAMLALVGRGIDQGLVELARLAEDSDGFVVTGSRAGRYQTLHFSFRDLGRAAGFSIHDAEPEAEAESAPSVSAAPGCVLSERAAAVASASPLRRRLGFLM